MLTPTSLKISPSVSNSPESLFFLSHFLNDWNFLEIEKSRPTKVLALKAQLGHLAFGKISTDPRVYKKLIMPHHQGSIALLQDQGQLIGGLITNRVVRYC